MNNISQISIFEYRKIENLGDLERLKIFFENIYYSNANNSKRTYKE